MANLIAASELRDVPSPPTDKEEASADRNGYVEAVLGTAVVALVLSPVLMVLWDQSRPVPGLVRVAFSFVVLFMIATPLLVRNTSSELWCRSRDLHALRIALAQVDLTRDGSNLCGVFDHLTSQQRGRLTRRQEQWLRDRMIAVGS